MVTERTLAVLRIMTGLLLAYHGLEIFKPEVMKMYEDWDSIKALPSGKLMTYVGKGAELVLGLMLAAGLFTRIAAAGLCMVMLFITFYIGEGRFWYEEQHPFLLAMLCAVFVVIRESVWSIDAWRNRRNG